MIPLIFRTAYIRVPKIIKEVSEIIMEQIVFKASIDSFLQKLYIPIISIMLY